ncbi:MAG: RpiB/LacA/LacB family sugar-phosphate isomerase [Microbacteriaceae bacterium]
MRIHLAADYGGYELGRSLEVRLAADGYETVWHGADEYDEGDDYPLFAVALGQAVVADQDAGVDACGILSVGNVIGGTVAVTKVNGVRAVPAVDDDLVSNARATVDVNVIVLPGRRLSEEVAAASVAVFLATDFDRELDDARRIVNVSEYESSGTIEGWMIER